MKRVKSLLAFVMIISLLSACGSEKAISSNKNEATDPEVIATSENSGLDLNKPEDAETINKIVADDLFKWLFDASDDDRINVSFELYHDSGLSQNEINDYYEQFVYDNLNKESIVPHSKNQITCYLSKADIIKLCESKEVQLIDIDYYNYETENDNFTKSFPETQKTTTDDGSIMLKNESDGIILNLEMENDTYELDSTINLTAVLENTTDETILIRLPSVWYDYTNHDVLYTRIVKGSQFLIDTSASEVADEAESYVYLGSGEKYEQKMTFKTIVSRYPEEEAEKGLYTGNCSCYIFRNVDGLPDLQGFGNIDEFQDIQKSVFSDFSYETEESIGLEFSITLI